MAAVRNPACAAAVSKRGVLTARDVVCAAVECESADGVGRGDWDARSQRIARSVIASRCTISPRDGSTPDGSAVQGSIPSAITTSVYTAQTFAISGEERRRLFAGDRPFTPTSMEKLARRSARGVGDLLIVVSGGMQPVNPVKQTIGRFGDLISAAHEQPLMDS